MSPRRSTASAAMSSDIVMGPPPPPPPLPPQTTAQQQQPSSKDNQDINEKYRRLKRRYLELEQKFKEAQHELRLSGERNVRMRDERELILQRVHELETRSEPNIPSVQWPPASAFPRSLLSTRSRHQFVSNLRQAMAEEDTDDHSVDPLLSSRHLGPLSHKHTDDELRERALATTEDDVGEGRRQAKRSRVSAKGKDRPSPQPQLPAASSNQSLNLHLAPTPQSQQPPNEVTATPLLVLNKGTKLRLKPPVKPAESDAARPPSPLSPIMSPREEHTTSYNAGPYNNGNTGPHPSSLPSSSMPTSAPGQSAGLVSSTSPAASVQPSEIQRHAKPKRLKAHTVTSKSYSIPNVPRDEKGKPLLPLSVGIMTVINLGEVCMREHFHTERYIFPVGYEVTRRYHSTVDPQTEAVYHCSIVDGGDGPKFKIVGSDAPNRPIIAGTATGAWSNIVKQANAIRNRQHSNSVSGPDFFGLGQNTIKHLIQELPGADRLKDYVWQHFAEGG
ncbi:FYRN-domain-containing protein [Pisolithus croceorrhizus]|nr:FYRN-domain-containing protein [Pisolithus croceorrhizus]